jgi:hypothetical protein
MALIGTPDFRSPRFRANPYPFYARLRAEAPVYRTNAFWFPVWLVTRYDDVLAVLKDERFSKGFYSRIPFMPRAFYRTLLNLDPPDHTRLRALVGRRSRRALSSACASVSRASRRTAGLSGSRRSHGARARFRAAALSRSLPTCWESRRRTGRGSTPGRRGVCAHLAPPRHAALSRASGS